MGPLHPPEPAGWKGTMELLSAIIAAVLYPGLLTVVALGLAFGLLARGRPALPATAGLGSREGRAALASVVCAGLGLAATPWPLHPAGGGTAWFWAWAGFEVAFLLPLLPALAAGVPGVVRAGIREAQLGGLARAVLWAALGVALAAHGDWRPATATAHLLAAAAALLALPAALGQGPFGAEENVTPGGTTAGLPPEARVSDAWAREVRASALLAASLVALLPSAVAPTWLALAMVAAGFVAGALLLRRLDGRLPRLTLPAALQLQALWALPLAAIASLALALAGRQ